MSTLNPYFYAYNPELLAFENAWVNFAKGMKINEAIIGEDIVSSWKRSKEYRLDPLKKNPPPVLSEQELKRRINKNRQLYDIVHPFMKTLYTIVKGSGFRVDLVDADGFILNSIGDKDTMEISKRTMSFPGANRSEEIAGTNSIAMAIITKKPIQVAGAQHYFQMFHIWSCSAAPILGTDGNLLGVLNMAGRYELVHQHTLGMVASTARAIENEIEIKEINRQLVTNNRQLEATLGAVTDGVIYVNKDKITHLNYAMSEILGKKAEKIIGKKINEAITMSPNLNEILKKTEKESYSEIVIKGKDRNYTCLLSIVHTDRLNGDTGMVLLFTRTEEIQIMANRINKYMAYFRFDDIIGKSRKLINAIDLAKKASEYNFRVIIEGESGTGKEIFAQAIHNNSMRKGKPFIALDCGAIPRELLESELFGYESGAFTGARKEGKPGKFEIANGGTIFLDEIGNMPIEMQAKMLRVLQEERVIRIGGSKPIPIDVRVIAATNANLEEEVKKGNFREDLFYRLNVFYIKIPPLRERLEDIPILAEYFISKSSSVFGDIKVDKQALKILENYDWPGNVRQLNNTIERAIIMSDGKRIQKKDLVLEPNKNGMPLEKFEGNELISLDAALIEHINKALKYTNGNVSEAARVLKVSRSTVYNALRRKD